MPKPVVADAGLDALDDWEPGQFVPDYVQDGRIKNRRVRRTTTLNRVLGHAARASKKPITLPSLSTKEAGE